MAIELVTGHAGTPHVSSADAGAFHAGIAGSGRYVLNTANKFAATMPDANTLTVATGDALFDGRHVRVTSPESVAIDSGGQGQTRHDIVGIEYSVAGGVESAAMTVVKGTPAASGAVDPDLPTGNILEGATTAFMPLYRVVLVGINADDPEPLFAELRPASSASESIDALEAVASYTHSISGVFGNNIDLALRRQGHIVTASILTTAANISRANEPIACGSIPQGYRPQRSSHTAGALVTNSNIDGQYRWTINSNGSVVFLSSATGLREIPLTVAYYTADPFPG